MVFWWCYCDLHEGGSGQVSRPTWYRHKKLQKERNTEKENARRRQSRVDEAYQGEQIQRWEHWLDQFNNEVDVEQDSYSSHNDINMLLSVIMEFAPHRQLTMEQKQPSNSKGSTLSGDSLKLVQPISYGQNYSKLQQVLPTSITVSKNFSRSLRTTLLNYRGDRAETSPESSERNILNQQLSRSQPSTAPNCQIFGSSSVNSRASSNTRSSWDEVQQDYKHTTTTIREVQDMLEAHYDKDSVAESGGQHVNPAKQEIIENLPSYLKEPNLDHSLEYQQAPTVASAHGDDSENDECDAEIHEGRRLFDILDDDLLSA